MEPVELSQIHAKVLGLLRPLLLFLATPLSLLFLGLEAREGLTPWVILQVTSVLVMSAAVVKRDDIHRRALPFAAALVGYATGGLLQFGWVFGAGMYCCVAVLNASFFFGARGGIASVTWFGLVTTAAVIGHRLGLIELQYGPSDSVVAVRMIATTIVSLTIVSLVFVRILTALSEAHQREYSARAEQALAEQERRRALEVAMQAQRLESAGRLASGVAHDFNNGLMVLQGTLELLGLELDPDKREELVAEGLAAIEGASTTTRQLLDFARPGGETEGQCDPGPVLQRLERSMRRVLPESIRLSAEIEACPTVPLPRGILEQVVLNLLINARDAISGPGEIRLRCRSDPAGDALLEVVDSGAGMSEATHERAFDAFFTTKADGTGLGLAMVHAFVTHSGGTVEIESRQGEGTRVLMRWTDRASAEAVEPVGDPTELGELGADEAILLIEDNRDVARVMARNLGRAGYAVTTVHTVADAQVQLDQRRFALVCSDGVLPDGTALDVQRVYARARLDGPMLVCTGYAARPELLEAVERGATLLAKPFAAAQLLERVHELLHPPIER